MWQTQESPTSPRGGRVLLLNDAVIDADRVMAVTASEVPDVIQVLLESASGVTTLGVAIPERVTRDEWLREITKYINEARGY